MIAKMFDVYSLSRGNFNRRDFISCTNLKYIMTLDTFSKWITVKEKYKRNLRAMLDDIFKKEKIE